MIPKYPHVHVRLTGCDGNAFAVIGKVRETLRRYESREVAQAFSEQALSTCHSYDDLLQLVMTTVEVD